MSNETREQRVQRRSFPSSSLASAPDSPRYQPSPLRHTVSAPFTHPVSHVNRRFLLNFLACHEYNHARRLGLPLPPEGEQRPTAMTVCLSREYTTVSLTTTLAPDESGESAVNGLPSSESGRALPVAITTWRR
ncbi:hypothetical protein MRX96_001640 [Rhipicephalus microplus]